MSFEDRVYEAYRAMTESRGYEIEIAHRDLQRAVRALLNSGIPSEAVEKPRPTTFVVLVKPYFDILVNQFKKCGIDFETD